MSRHGPWSPARAAGRLRRERRQERQPRIAGRLGRGPARPDPERDPGRPGQGGDRDRRLHEDQGFEYMPVDPTAARAALTGVSNLSDEDFQKRFGYGIATLYGRGTHRPIPTSDPGAPWSGRSSRLRPGVVGRKSAADVLRRGGHRRLQSARRLHQAGHRIAVRRIPSCSRPCSASSTSSTKRSSRTSGWSGPPSAGRLHAREDRRDLRGLRGRRGGRPQAPRGGRRDPAGRRVRARCVCVRHPRGSLRQGRSGRVRQLEIEFSNADVGCEESTSFPSRTSSAPRRNGPSARRTPNCCAGSSRSAAEGYTPTASRASASAGNQAKRVTLPSRSVHTSASRHSTSAPLARPRARLVTTEITWSPASISSSNE